MMKGINVLLGSLSLGSLIALIASADPTSAGSCGIRSLATGADCQVSSGTNGAAASAEIEPNADKQGQVLTEGLSQATLLASDAPVGGDAVESALGKVAGEHRVTAEEAADAIAAALTGGKPGTGSDSASGAKARMSRAERDALRLAAQGCWEFDPTSPAGQSTVTIGFDLDPDGNVVEPVHLVWHDAPNEGAADQAFEAAKRAILGCQDDAVVLPPEQQNQSRHAEMTFEAKTWAIR